MHSLTRRRALALGGAVAAMGASPVAGRAMPFERGDVVVGCTQLNNPTDDHRGRGRLLHYDAALKLKNTLWLDDTTHIVQGTRFAPDGTLWAFDAFAYKIVRFNKRGHRLPNFAAPRRSFAHISFAPDGNFYLGENFVGDKSRVALHTTIPYMPGTRSFGDGHLFKFSPRGKLLREYKTRTHGGIGGFQGLTASVLTKDGRSVIYTSESGPKIFHYDLANDRQLPDVVSYADNSGHFYFDLAFDRSGQLLVVSGLKIEALDMQGKTLREYPLQSFGWASMSEPVGDAHVYASNFFSGEIAKISLKTARILASAQTGIHKSLAGVAEFAG